MPKIEIIRNPFLNAVMYDVCYNLPDEVKKGLSIYYRRILFSERKTKGFCENSSIDTKLKFFNAIGLSNALTIFPDKSKSGAALKEILKKYEQQKLAAAQKEHAMLGVYVTTDKETSFLLGLMGQNINSKSFLLNLDYNKTAYHIKGWDKKLNTQPHNQLLDAVENASVVANTIFNAFLGMDATITLYGINQIDLQLVLYFFTKKDNYVSRETVWDKFEGYIQKKRTTMSLKRLLDNEFIKKHFDWQNLKYTITSKGIDLIHQYMKRVLKQNNFE
jgi:hypothetical protein